MLHLIKKLFLKENAQGMAEYALILALVAMGLIFALDFMRQGISNAYQSVADGFN